MILYHRKHCKIEKAVNFMVTVYSSALIFDPWNEIAECKASPALLYLSRGRNVGQGELIWAPAWTRQGGTRAQNPPGCWGCRVYTVPPKETLCHLAEDGTELFCTSPLRRHSSWPPPCLSASETKSYYAERIALERKKKGGGGIISAGVFMWFFFFFLIFLNPTGSLIII